MTKTEENINSMFTAVDSVLHSNQSEVDTLPALADSLTRFDNSLTELRAKDAEYKHLTAGKTEMKNEAEEDMIDALLPTASAMNVYAKINGLTDLKENTKVTITELRRMRDTELLNRANYLHDKGVELVAELGNYGITEQKLTDLKTLIDAYDTSLGNKDSSYAEKSAARKALSGLFEVTNEILKEEIDTLMELFRENNPDFYNEYKSARVIKDLGVSHSVPEEPEGGEG